MLVTTGGGGMATINVEAFGTVMIFRVPDDADMSGFHISSCRSRSDVQDQLNDYLEGQGYDPADAYRW
jgi:hypothetical protein